MMETLGKLREKAGRPRGEECLLIAVEERVRGRKAQPAGSGQLVKGHKNQNDPKSLNPLDWAPMGR